MLGMEHPRFRLVFSGTLPRVLPIFVIMLLSWPAPTRADSFAVISLRDFVGERLEYSLRFHGVSAARAHLTFGSAEPIAGAATGIIAAAVQTGSIADLLFHIDNHYSSVVDMASGFPIKFCKSIDQKNVQHVMTTEFDRLSRVARIASERVWSIQEESYELFSMLYKIRCSNVEIGDSLRFILDIEGQSWRATGAVSPGEPVHKPFHELQVRRMVLTFSPAGRLAPRKWKTDLLTHRICKEGARLTICFGPPPQSLPLYLQFGEGKSAVEMRLQKVHFQSMPR